MIAQMGGEPTSRGTILVVDDEEQLLRLLGRVLERAGYRVLTASDGGEAIECFREQAEAIGLVVLDVVIPPRGAREVLPALLERSPGMRVILASGATLEPDLAEQLELCRGIYLRKPFVPRTFLATVEKLLAMPHAQPGASPG